MAKKHAEKKATSIRIHPTLLVALEEVCKREPWIARNSHIEQAISEYVSRKLPDSKSSSKPRKSH